MKLLKFLFFLSALSLCACSDCDEQNTTNDFVPMNVPASQSRVSSQTNDFSVKLFDAVVREQKDANVLISPVSANIALSMLANAVQGTTRTELTQVLGFGDDLLNLNEYNKALVGFLPNVDKTAELYLPNSFWYTDDFVKDSFKSSIASLYSADVTRCTENQLPEKVNAWVSQKTKGHIDRILSDGETGEFAFLNCLYFKGIWTVPFESAKTTKAEFKNLDGTKVTRDFITADRTVQYAQGENFTAITIPFGNKAFSFEIYLPDEPFSTGDVIANLLENGIPDFTGNNSMSIKFPKMSMSNQTDLLPVMKSLGVKEVFGYAADFGPMTDSDDKHVQLFRQSNVFDLDEEGVKLTSATVIVGGTTGIGSGPMEKFEVDRPFVFLVREQSTRAILLAGRINKL